MAAREAIETVAARLREAERTQSPVAPFAHELGIGDVPGAYAVQRLNVAHWISSGRRFVGRKIGLTSVAVQKQLGVDQPDYGTLFADMELVPGNSIETAHLISPRVEAEIAFVLGRDIVAGDAAMADVVAAIGFVVPALEIVDSRIKDWKISIVDTIADNGASARFVLGSEPKSLDGADLASCAMRLRRNEEEVSAGTASACLGSPLNAALWLARTLIAEGEALRAGDMILTGALGPMVEARAGDEFEARIGSFSPVSVHFA